MVSYQSTDRSLKVVSMDDKEILGLCKKVIDVFLEWTPTCQDGDSMLVETSPEFVEKYRCVLTPVVVSCKGKMTTWIWVFNLNTDPIVYQGRWLWEVWNQLRLWALWRKRNIQVKLVVLIVVRECSVVSNQSGGRVPCISPRVGWLVSPGELKLLCHCLRCSLGQEGSHLSHPWSSEAKGAARSGTSCREYLEQVISGQWLVGAGANWDGVSRDWAKSGWWGQWGAS